MEDHRIVEDARSKRLLSPGYNYAFDKATGLFARWGATPDEDPAFSPFGPEIADIEVTTTCAGPGGRLCSFCYKANGPRGENMSLDTFRAVLDRMPRTLVQVAFGADADCTANPDIWAMMRYCREHPTNPVVPNITVADAAPATADLLAEHCGAVAVSRYADKDRCYDTVRALTDRGMAQVNIHQMVSEETFAQAMETVRDVRTDPRLARLNAVVFLSLKRKGRGTRHTPLAPSMFGELVRTALAARVPFGFDSCSAPKFLASLRGDPRRDRFLASTEPCESTLFSVYVDVRGRFHPCSFAPGHAKWAEGIDVAGCRDFLADVWDAPTTRAFRADLLANLDPDGVRACPLYEI